MPAVLAAADVDSDHVHHEATACFKVGFQQYTYSGHLAFVGLITLECRFVTFEFCPTRMKPDKTRYVAVRLPFWGVEPRNCLLLATSKLLVERPYFSVVGPLRPREPVANFGNVHTTARKRQLRGTACRPSLVGGLRAVERYKSAKNFGYERYRLG